MNVVELPSIKETPEDFERLEKQIRELFKREIYLPLIKALDAPREEVIINAPADDLVRAISSGRLRFYRGQFKGRLSATLSKELKRLGAEWDRTQGTWKIPQSKLPRDVQTAIGASEERMKRSERRVLARLAQISPEQLAEKLDAAKFFDTALWKTDKKITKQVERITVSPKLTAEARAKIAEEYTQNLRLYIQKWSKEEIVELRGRIEKAATSGNRYESMVLTIQKSYGVSQRKAKFLARQETGILMAKFKETRYRDAGSEEYTWRCVHGSPLHPVRPFHKKLDGTRQKWSSPPIIDKNGNRKHPGEDYGCRCSARPILKF